jgi:hypothetical protein
MIYKYEVRIGNLFHYKGFITELISVDDVPKFKGEDGRQAISGLLWEQVEPIPINIPLLEKYGFTIDSAHNSIHISGIHLIQADGEWFLMQGMAAISKPYKYLHEVQNLYFVTNGVELINSTIVAEGMNHYRIGNLVDWGREHLPITVITASAAESTYRTEPPLTRSHSFMPIELSENWFSCLGFTINTTLVHPQFPQYYFNKEHDGYYMRTSINGYINKSHPVKSVHQLQNYVSLLQVKN